MDLSSEFRQVLMTVRAVDQPTTALHLKGLSGRGPGGYVLKMTEWLERNRDSFSKRISATVTDHPSDAGVDILVEEPLLGTRVGIQVKSDADVGSSEFTQKTKAQIADSKVWGIDLLVIVLACEPNESNLIK